VVLIDAPPLSDLKPSSQSYGLRARLPMPMTRRFLLNRP
jgi:hypothetical protein